MVLVETHIPRSARILLVCLLVSVACMPRAVGQECEFESFLDAIPGDIFGDTSIFKTAIKISGYQVRLPQFRGTRFEDTARVPCSARFGLGHLVGVFLRIFHTFWMKEWIFFMHQD